MEMSLKGKYANVTREAISIYLDLCSVCAAKPARNLPKALKYSSGCGQFSLIEMQPEGDYRFVLNYQDSTSRFTHLRRLKSVQSCIAKKLLKIFLTFGLPSVLGSDLGLEFTNSVIASLKAMWPEGGKLQAGQAEKPNHEIRNSIKNWMQSTGCTSWTQSLPFVQWTINNSFHQGNFASLSESFLFNSQHSQPLARHHSKHCLEENFPLILPQNAIYSPISIRSPQSKSFHTKLFDCFLFVSFNLHNYKSTLTPGMLKWC